MVQPLKSDENMTKSVTLEKFPMTRENPHLKIPPINWRGDAFGHIFIGFQRLCHDLFFFDWWTYFSGQSPNKKISQDHGHEKR